MNRLRWPLFSYCLLHDPVRLDPQVALDFTTVELLRGFSRLSAHSCTEHCSCWGDASADTGCAQEHDKRDTVCLPRYTEHGVINKRRLSLVPYILAYIRCLARTQWSH